ncbi:MAG TPA: hypothetical protein VKT70_11040 [Stellaceae bacterium]|nr:hypothetical protein [Stellaceae bacterium]
MSAVTGFVLIYTLAEDVMSAEHPPGSVARINQWLAERNFEAPAELADRYASGNKHPQLYLHAAGYNHFPEDAFIDFFATLPWQCPENVILILQPEAGATRIVRPSHRATPWRVRSGDYRIEDAALGLSGELYGNCPVQGEGTICGFYFYFRARGNAWSCEVVVNRAHPCPTNLAGYTDDQHDVFFECDGIVSFVHCGDYGEQEFDAGWMPYEDAERFIRACAAAFINKMAPNTLGLRPKA